MWFLELEFLNECLTKNVLNINTIVLMVNVRFHQAEIFSQFFRDHFFNFDFLRAYNSKLNPIKKYVTEVITEIITDVDFRNFYNRISELTDWAFRKFLF
ncbi:hypothetical protein MXB_4713 [Myxobolus squamalis]|nr:hypothetical protein MXB_4713 [Myxobolus squamalis]